MHIAHEEYLQANHSIIESITREVDQLIDGSNDTFSLVKDPLTEEYTTNGFITPNQVYESYLEEGLVLPDSPEKLADIHNKKLMVNANVNIIYTHASATMLCVTEFQKTNPNAKIPQDLPWNTADNPFNPLVPYTQAEWKTVEWNNEEDGGIIELSSICLSGIIGNHGTKKEHMITISDSLLTQSLAFGTFGQQICSAYFNLRPTEDELARRCVKLFGPEAPVVTMLLGGSFETTEELDAKLDKIRLAHQARFSEEVIEPLFDEVRQRGLAARQSRELNHEHSLDLPNVDKLIEIRQLLTTL